jgi:hypothetical protein
MSLSVRMKQGLFAAALVLTLLLAATMRVVAGTTGSVVGIVIDPVTTQPASGARVTAASPSQTVSTVTDGAGRFWFASLRPDTYTLHVAANSAHRTAQFAVVTVVADQSRTVTIGQPSGGSNRIARGTTADVSSVDTLAQDDASTLNGGTLESAWSAISSVPGAYVAPDLAGYADRSNPAVSIRGGDYNQIGYELDGVPVNRSFDNYPSSQLSSLGQQELEVYTGAAPPAALTGGIAGYVNQVVKTGTAPAYGSVELGIGTPSFSHEAAFESGGTNPARTSSYYVGLGGQDRNYRYADQFDGAAVSPLYGVPIQSCNAVPKANYSAALVPSCFDPAGRSYTNGGATNAYVLGPYALDTLATARERDNVVNLHVAIPRKNGSTDDVQFLWDESSMSSIFSDSSQDQGGAPYLRAIGLGAPTYSDGYQFVGAPLGTLLGANYTGGGVIPYTYPLSPAGRALQAEIAPDRRDGSSNDQSVIKLQYQRNFGTDAFLRVYGYTNYGDWLENNPISAVQLYTSAGDSSYAVLNHGRGLNVQLTDRLGARHLLTVTGSTATATSLRDNDTEMINGGFGAAVANARTVVGVLVDSSNPTNGVCYTPAHIATTCFARGGALTGTLNGYSPANPGGAQFFTLQQANDGSVTPAAGVCGGGPCAYLVAGNGTYATYNTVRPAFFSTSVADSWKPDDRLTVELALRYDRFVFHGADTTDTDARTFWYNAYDTQFATDVRNVSGQIEAYDAWQPRLGFTYAVAPATLLRGSYGRYAQAPNASLEQYNYLQANDVASLAIFGTYGLPTTPGHDVRPQISNNYDFSVEHAIGRGLFVKASPFLRKSQDQIQHFFLDQKTNFVSGLNVGRQTSQGIELEVDGGDFARDGLAGRLSFTYSDSFIDYAKLPNGTTIVDPINAAITAYDGFTRAGGGAPCYKPGTPAAPGAADPGCAAGSVANPYYNAPAQPLLDPGARYPTYDTFPGPIGVGYNAYGSPYVATALLQYKHGPLAITPALQLSAGQRYGAPETTPGVTPGTCQALTGTPGVGGDARYDYGGAGGAPYDAATCSAGLAIPDRFTKRFDGVGAFVRPVNLQVHMRISYDVNRRFSLVGNITNIVNSCFGGSKVPFAVAGACAYGPVNGAGSGPQPYGNVYNPGNALQPFLVAPYEPAFSRFPLELYVQGRLRL